MLWTGETAEKIKDYLQPGGAFGAFQSTLGLCESYLEETAKKLVGVLRPPRVCRGSYSLGTLLLRLF